MRNQRNMILTTTVFLLTTVTAANISRAVISEKDQAESNNFAGYQKTGAVDSEMTKIFNGVCLYTYGECWLTLKSSMPYWTERHRRSICLLRVHRLDFCETVDEDFVERAIQEAEERREESKLVASRRGNKSRDTISYHT